MQLSRVDWNVILTWLNNVMILLRQIWLARKTLKGKKACGVAYIFVFTIIIIIIVLTKANHLIMDGWKTSFSWDGFLANAKLPGKGIILSSSLQLHTIEGSATSPVQWHWWHRGHASRYVIEVEDLNSQDFKGKATIVCISWLTT